MKKRKSKTKAKRRLNGIKTSARNFRQADLTRMLRSMQAAGVPIGEISIKQDRVTVSAGGAAERARRAAGSGYMSMRDACHYGNFGRSRAYELIAEGSLRIKKSGRKTLVSKASIDRWIAALPEHPPRKR